MINEYLELKKINNIKYINKNKESKKIIIWKKLVIFIVLFNLLIISLLKVEIIINQIQNCRNEIINIEKYKEINGKGILLNKKNLKKLKNQKYQ